MTIRNVFKCNNCPNTKRPCYIIIENTTDVHEESLIGCVFKRSKKSAKWELYYNEKFEEVENE